MRCQGEYAGWWLGVSQSGCANGFCRVRFVNYTRNSRTSSTIRSAFDPSDRDGHEEDTTSGTSDENRQQVRGNS